MSPSVREELGECVGVRSETRPLTLSCMVSTTPFMSCHAARYWWREGRVGERWRGKRERERRRERRGREGERDQERGEGE